MGQKGEKDPTPLGGSGGPAEENFEYFISESINLMHFEKKFKQNYKTV